MSEQDFEDIINNLWNKMRQNKPQKLYKYSSIDSKRVNTWLRGKIYMSTSNQLNDVHECKRMYYDEEVVKKCLGEYADILYTVNEIGHMIYSLSSNSCNRLLWAYYTNNSGICFEYELAEKCNAWKVIYYPNKQNMTPYLLDTLSPEPVFSEAFYKKMLYTNYFTKHTDWSCENEYRLIKQGDIETELNGTELEKQNLHEISLDELGLKITKITLGVNFDYEANFEKVRQLYEYYKCNVRILRRSNETFDFIEKQPAGFKDYL